MATKSKDVQTEAQAPISRGEVATIAPPRLPYHPEIEARFGVDRAGWRALVDAVFPMAKSTDAVILALSYCRARHLDPFKRMVHIVPMWNSALRREVETVWPGIGEHRATAMRSGQYGGCDATAFGPIKTMTFEGRVSAGRDEYKTVKETVTFPEWAQVTVYRMVQGQRVPVPGPRVYWLETYSKRGKADVPNDRWCRAPSQMIEKCAEAAALRKAFPEEIGDTMSAEEAEGRETELGSAIEQARDITPAKPTRADFEAKPEPVNPAPTAAEIAEAEAGERALDAGYVATMSGRMPDDPAHDEDGVVEPEPAPAQQWSVEAMPIPGMPKPKSADVLTWARALGDHVKAADTLGELKLFLKNNDDGIVWFKQRYAEPYDALRDIIDEKLAALAP